MTKATHKKTIIDVLKTQKRLQKKTYGLGRQNLAGYSSVSGALAVFHQTSSADSGGGNVTSLIKAAGDTMVGPIAYFLVEEDIVSGELDVSQDGGYSSRVVVGSQSGTTDNLVRISGSIHTGQILFLQGKSTDTITIKHYTTESTTKGNIYMPSGSDYTLAAKEIVLFQWDTENKNPTYSSDADEAGQWTLVATSTGSGGGTGMQNPAVADLNMSTFDIINICATKFDNADGTELNSTDYGMEVYGNDLRYNIYGGASTNDNAHAFRVDNTTKLEIYEERTKVWNSIWMAAYPNNIIKSSTANEMGYQVTNDSITAGSEGTMQIPYKESTAGQSVGSNATLDGWFGNADGCTGIQYDSSVSAGSGRYRHWLRLNGGWYKSEAY